MHAATCNVDVIQQVYWSTKSIYVGNTTGARYGHKITLLWGIGNKHKNRKNDAASICKIKCKILHVGLRFEISPVYRLSHVLVRGTSSYWLYLYLLQTSYLHLLLYHVPGALIWFTSMTDATIWHIMGPTFCLGPCKYVVTYFIITFLVHYYTYHTLFYCLYAVITFIKCSVNVNSAVDLPYKTKCKY